MRRFPIAHLAVLAVSLPAFSQDGRNGKLLAGGKFRDPEIARRAVNLLLNSDFDIRESLRVTYPEVRDFFAERAKAGTGGERILAQTLEVISLCDARVKAQKADVAAFLSRY